MTRQGRRGCPRIGFLRAASRAGPESNLNPITGTNLLETAKTPQAGFVGRPGEIHNLRPLPAALKPFSDRRRLFKRTSFKTIATVAEFARIRRPPNSCEFGYSLRQEPTMTRLHLSSAILAIATLFCFTSNAPAQGVLIDIRPD